MWGRFHFSHREHSNFVNCIRYSPDGTKFITGSSDKKGMIYDGKSGDKIGELASEDGHKGRLYAVSWISDMDECFFRCSLSLLISLPRYGRYLKMELLVP